MPSKTSAQRLRDILENIDLVQAFTSGLAYTDFESDRKTVYAVVRALEIISEATRRLPGELPLWAGTGVDAIRDIPSAADLVPRLWRECLQAT